LNERASNWTMRLLAPTGVVLGVLLVWSIVAALRFVPENTFPGPLNVVQAFKEELGSGRMVNDLIVSLFRVTVGFLLAAAGSVPLGLLLGHHLVARMALLPAVNFMRNISPLAWVSGSGWKTRPPSS
jgi:NitT/TauT family transport system permease protein